MNRLHDLETLLRNAVNDKDEELAKAIIRSIIEIGADVQEGVFEPQRRSMKYKAINDQQTIFDAILAETDDFELAFKLGQTCSSVDEAMEKIHGTIPS